MNKVEKIQPLQGLRVLATLGIFLFHSGILLKGTFPVTLFFMLSGFMMYYTKHDNITITTGKKKIFKMYPLHIITFLVSFLVGNVFDNYDKIYILKASVLQILLMQSWFKDYRFSFNGLSWYLSITLFLYLVSYPLIKFINKLSKYKIWLFVTLFLIILLNIYDGFNSESILYTNPLYRCLDFFLGMLVARIFICSKGIVLNKPNLLEILLLLWFIAQYAISLFMKSQCPGYFSILFAVALFVFSKGDGFISKILSLNIFDKLASYTFEFYMIHELVLRVFRKIFDNEEMFYPVRLLLIAVPSFVITCLLAILYKKIYNILKRKRIQN